MSATRLVGVFFSSSSSFFSPFSFSDHCIMFSACRQDWTRLATVWRKKIVFTNRQGISNSGFGEGEKMTEFKTCFIHVSSPEKFFSGLLISVTIIVTELLLENCL